ncbi:MAG: cytochrome C biogenesis protein CycH [Candidatus Margulisiibacteriota bacterium]|nr:MAG: cytochrome C biogenesis protein CycH [Candidatus Margulisbacteria bacterium GWF2_38_17]PZM82112.1 MAG: cytochrome C biogenesis protein CycH [Candidatus Margulisiibacteriota bacterium]HAR63630.1 cytochrome C biogenesis protein CycH [Candidatus Margulisiibacteriota bacterium]HCT84374.1 cytochrome C biogenesis protein CycH [Candidatus Margulisiibacteriota bacterium]
MDNGEVHIYQSPEGDSAVDVVLKDQTVWLSQDQMSKLFEKAKSTINEHIKNIYKEKELSEDQTMRKFGNSEYSTKPTNFYNLDVIISVGYRVKSLRGTQFRIWANKVLNEYLTKGYVINEQRLKKQTEKIRELESTIHILSTVIENKELGQPEAVGLLKVITDYTYALDLLDQYDYQVLEIKDTNINEIFKITYDEAMAAIRELGHQFRTYDHSTFFGTEKDDSFKGSLYNIYQTYAEQELYPSIEEKAAHLLYFVIKNHSFIDGNKRIGAFLFIWFLERNEYLYNQEGKKRIEDNALVAICLMVAESRPDEKDTITKLIVNLINRHNP